MLGVTSAELLDAAGGVHELLLTGEERMAGRTYLNLEFGENRTDFEGAATGAHGIYSLVFGVYIFFHDLLYPPHK